MRRQNQEHCASITCMIRHYVARRAQVSEAHPHNAAAGAESTAVLTTVGLAGGRAWCRGCSDHRGVRAGQELGRRRNRLSLGTAGLVLRAARPGLAGLGGHRRQPDRPAPLSGRSLTAVCQYRNLTGCSGASAPASATTAAKAPAGRQAPGRLPFSTTVEFFGQHGFSRGRQVGKHAWIVSRQVSPA